MSTLMSYLITTVVGAIIVAALQLFSWPNIPSTIETYMTYFFSFLYTFDGIVNVGLMLKIAIGILTIETWLWAIRILIKIYQFVSGSQFSSGKKTDL